MIKDAQMSLTPLYEDQLLFNELYDILSAKNHALIALELGFSDKNTRQMLQVDGIFHRF